MLATTSAAEGATVSECIAALFGRHPELIGFSIEDPAIAQTAEPAALCYDRLIVQIEVRRDMSIGRYVKIHESVRTEIEGLMAIHPAVFGLLRGRTFARTLH